MMMGVRRETTASVGPCCCESLLRSHSPEAPCENRVPSPGIARTSDLRSPSHQSSCSHHERRCRLPAGAPALRGLPPSSPAVRACSIGRQGGCVQAPGAGSCAIVALRHPSCLLPLSVDRQNARQCCKQQGAACKSLAPTRRRHSALPPPAPRRQQARRPRAALAAPVRASMTSGVEVQGMRPTSPKVRCS